MLTRHIRESLQVTPGPFPDFWVGPGDEAMFFLGPTLLIEAISPLSAHAHSLVPRPHPLSHEEKRSGEPSPISWASARFCDNVT